MDKNKKYFHFTLGPVQSFVGQARRTRDFWAGSFLLSWLSGIAMQSVITQQRHLSSNETLDVDDIILFPRADRNFLNAIANGCDEGNAPKQGGIPNRFKAKVDANFDPQRVIDDVQEAWQALAKKIYDAEIDKHVSNKTQNYTQSIWDRQVKSFWDITWVLVDNENDSSSLDRRKNWRSHYLPDEAGIKCSLMGDWQELSGIEGISAAENKRRKEFWANVFKTKDKTVADYSEGEFLCAISYIKRRFIQHFDREFKLPNASNNGLLQSVHGWELKNEVPSVYYMAAANWWTTILKTCSEDNKHLLINFFKAAIEKNAESNTTQRLCQKNEYNSTIKCIEESIEKNKTILSNIIINCCSSIGVEFEKELSGVDAILFYESALSNPNHFPAEDKEGGIKLNPQAGRVLKALGKLVKGFDIGEPSPFYAILMMDGDSLGKQIGDKDKQTHITNALSAFTDKVGDIVSNNNGFLIYAGGDDVLALLPLENALDCAATIRQHYEQCFYKEVCEAKKEIVDKDKDIDIEYSISAAILYSHINTPLSNALHDIHHLLDDIAKTQTGRNALAVQVRKQSGINLTWAKPWDNKRLSDDQTCERGDTVFHTLTNDEKKLKSSHYISAFGQEGTQSIETDTEMVLLSLFNDFQTEEKNDPQFSNQFFYKIRQNFSLFSPDDIDTATQLMATEFCRSRGYSDSIKVSDAKQFVEPLLKQCQDIKGNINVDAALFIRFLAKYSIGGK